MKKEKQEEAHEEELSFENKGTIKQLADELLELLEQNSEDQSPSSRSTAKIESIDHMNLVEQALEKFTEEKPIDQGKIEVDQKTEEALITDQAEIEMIKEKNPIEQTTDQWNPELTDEMEKANLIKMVEQALEKFEDQNIIPQAKEEEYQENKTKILSNELRSGLLEEIDHQNTGREIQKRIIESDNELEERKEGIDRNIRIKKQENHDIQTKNENNKLDEHKPLRNTDTRILNRKNTDNHNHQSQMHVIREKNEIADNSGYAQLNLNIEKEFKNSLNSNYKGDTTSIKGFVAKINTHLNKRGILDSDTYDLLTRLGADDKYPNLAMVYKKDGQRSLELLDQKLYDSLVEHQNQSNFRLEWQRFWFEGLGETHPFQQNYRKVFLQDSTDDQSLPSDMRRIWAMKNQYTWNSLTPAKRELHSKSIKDFFDTLFEKRPKFSDFKDVRDFTYQKGMDRIWNRIQQQFDSDISLKTDRRPAIFPLKQEYSREKIEHSLIGTFWNYHNNLDKVAKRNLKSWGYKNLLEYMEKEATGVYQAVVDPNYVGQRFIIRVTDKGRTFDNFLTKLGQLRNTSNLESKYAINQIYREWILNSELSMSKDLDGFIWTVDDARRSRTVIFKDIRDLMNENNSYGIGKVVEALFENETLIKRINKISGLIFSAELNCKPSGYERINTGATSIAYPDLIITQPDCKPINIQIKDLGKCNNQEKEELVLVDQLKSLFGEIDEFQNITVHVINALDKMDLLDPSIHTNLINNYGTNCGIINIGIWENIKGVSKFGEIFSALRTQYNAGYNGDDVVVRTIDYLKKVHTDVSTNDISLIEKLEGMWSEKLDELIANISEQFGSFFTNETLIEEQERNLRKHGWEKSRSKDVHIYQTQVTPIQDQFSLQKIRPLPSMMKGGVSIEQLTNILKDRPLYRRFWLECIGQIEVTNSATEKGPRGLIVDLTKDLFLPETYRKPYMVKNSLRWNSSGYEDRSLNSSGFAKFSKLLFKRTLIKSDFAGESEFPRYIWNRIQVEWGFTEKSEFRLLSPSRRPRIFKLKDEFISMNVPSQMNESTKTSIKEFVSLVNNQINTKGIVDETVFRELKELNTETVPNLALILVNDQTLILEFLELNLYTRLKKNLTSRNNRLTYQRFWFECTDQIRVTSTGSKQSPKGLIIDLTRDPFLPEKHRNVYMVKNNLRWNAYGYKDNLLSDGSFNDFANFLFTKKTITDFSKNVQYPRYIWEQIQTEWGIDARDGFKLKPHNYRPNIYVLKEEFSKETVVKTMVGVYQEFISFLSSDKRHALRRRGFKSLTEYLDEVMGRFHVFRPSQITKDELDTILRDLKKFPIF